MTKILMKMYLGLAILILYSCTLLGQNNSISYQAGYFHYNKFNLGGIRQSLLFKHHFSDRFYTSFGVFVGSATGNSVSETINDQYLLQTHFNNVTNYFGVDAFLHSKKISNGIRNDVGWGANFGYKIFSFKKINFDIFLGAYKVKTKAIIRPIVEELTFISPNGVETSYIVPIPVYHHYKAYYILFGFGADMTISKKVMLNTKFQYESDIFTGSGYNYGGSLGLSYQL